MFGIIAVSLSVLVILAGLSMLAKSKKESLGKLYIFSSYAAIFIGLGLFIGGNIGGMKRLVHANCGSSCYSSGGHGGASSCASYSTNKGGGGCGHASFGHGSYGHGSSCGYGGKQSCSSGGHAGYGQGSCGHAGCSHGGEKHKVIKKIYRHDGGENIKIKVEVEEEDNDEAEDDE